jgi:hypothetical protein
MKLASGSFPPAGSRIDTLLLLVNACDRLVASLRAKLLPAVATASTTTTTTTTTPIPMPSYPCTEMQCAFRPGHTWAFVLGRPPLPPSVRYQALMDDLALLAQHLRRLPTPDLLFQYARVALHFGPSVQFALACLVGAARAGHRGALHLAQDIAAEADLDCLLRAAPAAHHVYWSDLRAGEQRRRMSQGASQQKTNPGYRAPVLFSRVQAKLAPAPQTQPLPPLPGWIEHKERERDESSRSILQSPLGQPRASFEMPKPSSPIPIPRISLGAGAGARADTGNR